MNCEERLAHLDHASELRIGTMLDQLERLAARRSRFDLHETLRLRTPNRSAASSDPLWLVAEQRTDAGGSGHGFLLFPWLYRR